MQGYSLQNARKFQWASITGDLNNERISHLETHLIGRRILDAGCGGGAYVQYLANKGFDVTGIDKTTEFLDVARKRGGAGTYLQADITELPFGDNSFDCSYCFDVLEHVDDRLAIKELARVTHKRLIIAVPMEDNEFTFGLTYHQYRDLTHLRYYTEESLHALLREIQPCQTKIVSELPIPFEAFMRQVVVFHLEKSMKMQLRYLTLKMALSQLGRLRRPNMQSLTHQARELLTDRLFREASYKDIPSGLVAVVDLRSNSR